MTLYRTGLNADKADVESLVKLGVLVPVEPDRILHLSHRSRIEAIPTGEEVGIVTWLDAGDWQIVGVGEETP